MENKAPDLVMTNPTSGLDGQQLMAFVSRIEKLNEDAEAIAADLKEVYNKAKSAGFDKKYVREIVKLRKLDQDELYEQDELVKMYREAAGL